MILLITKDKNIELPSYTEMYQDQNKIWWWKKMFSIDGKIVDNPNGDYEKVYKDGE